jgi:Ran GTPase-activating protein (RanGAP) involved in mRNA processing and transport
MGETSVDSEINPRLTENTCDEPDASLMPLEDYQHSDLVPLETATETIKPLFRNLPRDVWIAKNASKKPPDSLTSDESAAIHLYTMELKNEPLYSLLNQLLRDRDRRKLKPWFSYLKLFLTALFKLPSYSGKIVWRGVKKDLHSKYHRGEKYTWWAFSSCTQSLEVLERPLYLGTTGDRTLFSIECLNGKNIKPHSYYKTEDEILLLPGFYFEVMSKVAGGNGLHIIHLREIVPPFCLLETPFDIPPPPSPSITSTIDSILDKVYDMNKDNDDMYKLFVVLSNPSSAWNSKRLFENEYILHFVCECSTNEMHFACYPAYSVPNPRVFFQIYGEYIKQFMIPLAGHLFDHQNMDKYHDTRFWSEYKTNIDKIAQAVNAIAAEPVIMTKVYDTSALKELLIPSLREEDYLYRSITTEMNVRWVCLNHYPIDQLNLIHELRDIQNVELNINESTLRFTGEIDLTHISHVCDVFTRGLRLYRIYLSELKASPSSLQQLTRRLCTASLIAIDYSPSMSKEPSDSDKLKIETVLELCNETIASNRQLKHVNISINKRYSQSNDGIIDALRPNRSLRTFSYGLKMASEDITRLMSMFEQNQLITTLKLSNHALTSKNVQTIAAFIRSSRTLTNLRLSSSEISDEGMQIIVDALCANPIMKKLNVLRNNLSDNSAPLITHVLQTCSTLTSLDVSWNKISVFGARLIFEELETNRTLLHFDISNNKLSLDHARKTTNYNGTIIAVGDLIARMLLKNTTLCTLDISRIEVSDNELRPLAEALVENRTLAHLKLGGDKHCSKKTKQITDVLHWDCSLIGLDLSNSVLDESEIRKLSEILRKNNKLRYLNLSRCNLDDKRISIVAEAFKKNRTVSHITLAANNLTNVGIAALVDAIQINQNIIYFNIDFNKIGDDGAKAIAQTLFDNHTLTCIDVRSNKISDIGGQAIAHALNSNRSLVHLNIVFENKLSSSMLTKLRLIRRNLKIA